MQLNLGLFWLLALSCLAVSDCGTVRSRSEAPRPAGPEFMIRVDRLPGWVDLSREGADGFLLINQERKGQVRISTFTSERGGPREVIGSLMLQLEAQGAVIGSIAVESSGQTARMPFSITAGNLTVKGQVLCGSNHMIVLNI